MSSASCNDDMSPLSVLDLVPVTRGATPRDALRKSLDLARQAERFGYRRYWVAEHHNMTGIASAATSVVIGYLAGVHRAYASARRGIMLPNHAPLVIAEQFGTLESLSAGSTSASTCNRERTRRGCALRRDPARADEFPQDVVSFRRCWRVSSQDRRFKQCRAAGSTFHSDSARAHSALNWRPSGTALSFASATSRPMHSSGRAFAVYRARFQPSTQLQLPHAMIGERGGRRHDRRRAHLFTTTQQAFTNLARGRPGPQQPPIDDIEPYWSPSEKLRASHMLMYSIVGSAEAVSEGLRRLVEATRADELMVVSNIYDHAKRVRSYEIVADVARS
jgi:luciferase family oxidoreductase group 1